MSGRQNVERWLLHELQVDAKKRKSIGNTALHDADEGNEIECARLHLNKGAQNLKDLSIRHCKDNNNKMHRCDASTSIKIHGSEDGYRKAIERIERNGKSFGSTNR